MCATGDIQALSNPLNCRIETTVQQLKHIRDRLWQASATITLATFGMHPSTGIPIRV
jgi:hypothetical protein